jgi:hypothetical protein
MPLSQTMIDPFVVERFRRRSVVGLSCVPSTNCDAVGFKNYDQIGRRINLAAAGQESHPVRNLARDPFH